MLQIYPAILHEKDGYMTEKPVPRSWNEIEEVYPDEWDLKMLNDIDKNPDCHEFVSQETLLEELDLTL